MRARAAAVLLVAAAACVALGLAAAPTAHANGDPPSDVLPVQDYYTPFRPPLPKPMIDALKAVTSSARREGYPLKVAIVASTADLGTVPSLFGKPQQYANFLGPEIEFGRKVPLLVVMANGYGTHDIPPATASAVQGLKPPGEGGDALGRGAIEGVVALARAAGHPIPKPRIAGSSGGGGGTSPAVIFGVPVALLAIVGLVLTARRRAEEEPAAEPPAAEAAEPPAPQAEEPPPP